MIYYLLVLFHLFFVKNRNVIVFAISFALLFIIMGFRDEDLGTDAKNYQLMFHFVEQGLSLSIEPLWYLLNKVIYIQGGNYSNVIMFSSLLALVPVYISAFRLRNENGFLLLFLYLSLYYYFYSFNIIRQGIGMSWGILALVYLNSPNKKNHKIFWLFIVLGALFHYTVFALGILKFIPTIFAKIKNLYLYQFIAFVLGLFFNTFLITLFSQFAFEKYSDFEGGNLIGNFFYLIILNVVFIMISNLVKIKSNWYYYMYFFILISNLFIRFPFGNRFILLFGIVQLVFYPLILSNNKLSTKENGLLWACILVYGFISFSRVLGAGEIIPYEGLFFSF